MTTTSLKYRIVTEHAGQPVDLFKLGLSFKLMLELKLLPPLPVMNDFLRCGRDDLDDEDGILAWKPFELTQAKYESLAAMLRRRGHVVSIEKPDPRTPRTYDAWFSSKIAERERKNKGPKRRSA